ncbi:hypothetical protein AGR1C_Cc11239 [Agrobacterium fabacearum TT111]|nr:hypothetical protein AGR1C_Cc11239 [Agrobacterium fabacearum TT111]
MNFTRSAAIFDGAGPLGARIARLAGALVLPVVFSVAAFVSCVPQALAVEPLIANQARIIGDEARTRIVLDFAEEPEFDIHYLDSPARIVVDFPAVNFAFPASALAPTGLFSDIRFGSMGQDSARIVLTAKNRFRWRLPKPRRARTAHRSVSSWMRRSPPRPNSPNW